MKRLFTLSIIAVLFAASCSFGAVTDFGTFTLDIPEGWTASQDGSMAIVTRNDGAAALSMTLDSTDGVSLEDLAKAFAKEFNASDLKPTGDGDYAFSFTTNGVKSDCLLSGGDGMYIMIVMTGDDVPTMTAIRNTFAFK